MAPCRVLTQDPGFRAHKVGMVHSHEAPAKTNGEPMHQPAINTLRGVACLLLVGFHVVGFSPTTGMRLPLDHWASITNEWLSLLRMPLFSFLSGYVYALRPYDGQYGAFTRGKARRLLIPMLVVGTSFAILHTLTPATQGSPIDWRLLHIVPVAHYWFLESLFVIFMLTALLERAGMLGTPGRFALVAGCAAVLHMTAPVPVYFGLEGATYLFPFFLLGIATLRFGSALVRPAVQSAAGATLVVILLVWGVAVPISLPEPLAPQALLASLCLCVMLFRWCPSIPVLAWIGSFSFGIYLFHSIIAAAARVALGVLGIPWLPLLFVAGMAAGIGGSILLTLALRRVPAGHWVLGERARKKRVPDTPSATAGDTTVAAGRVTDSAAP